MIVTVTRPSTGIKYTVTNEHSASSYGIPVVLVDGNLIDFYDPHVMLDTNMSDSAGERLSTPEEEAAADMESLRIGLEAGAMDDPKALEMVQAAYYGHGVTF